MVGACDLEGGSLAELELWSAVDCREGLAVQLKGNNHNVARLFSVHFVQGLSIALNVGDLPLLKTDR